MKNKQAVSHHIEMIISFMLFIVFVMFLLVFIKPYERNTLSESVLNGLHGNFEEMVSVDLTSVFVKVDVSGVDCEDKKINKIKLLGDVADENALMIKEVGDSFYLFISSDITNEDDLFGNCEDFTVGSVETKKIISQKKLEEFASDYPYSYDDLKSALGVPKTIDFIIDFAGGENMERYIPLDVDVIAQFTTKPVLLNDGSIVNKEFVFRIW